MKPLWIEQFMNDEELYEVFTGNILKIMEGLPRDLEHSIVLEGCNMEAKQDNVIRKTVYFIPEALRIGTRLLDRFEQNKFLSSSLIEEYRQKIRQIKDKLLEITIRENLKNQRGLK